MGSDGQIGGGGAESKDNVSTSTAPTNTLSIGTHTIKVPAEVAAYLQALLGQERPILDGTRVWMQRKKGAFLLHLGDVDRGSLED
jgi:hypothetical protein